MLLPAACSPAAVLQIYLVVLTVRILLSWFRTIDWYAEPWNSLRQVRCAVLCYAILWYAVLAVVGVLRRLLVAL